MGSLWRWLIAALLCLSCGTGIPVESSFETRHGALTSCPGDYGDLTQDSLVNVVDIQCHVLISLWQLSDETALGPSCLSGDVSEADLNCDGDHGISDLLVNIHLALGTTLAIQVDEEGDGCVDLCQTTCALGAGDTCNGQFCDDEQGCYCPAGLGGPNCSVVLPSVPAFGGDEGPQFVVIATAEDGLSVPRDLAFHPSHPEQLWVVNRADDATVMLTHPGEANQTALWQQDVLAYHYMEEVSSLAFGENGFFATCQESLNTYNDTKNANEFMGPTLWDSDPEIYATIHQDWEPGVGAMLGSHMDMLHESPLCMGIAHDFANVYWAFDGYHSMLMRFDFEEDHGPGGNNHSDGITRRYPEVGLTRVPDVAGHLDLEQSTGLLYIADTGGKRILRVDTNTGEVSGEIPKKEWTETLVEYSQVEGVAVSILVASGLVEPSGLVLGDDLFYVSDHASAEIIAYTLDGVEVSRLQTFAESISGLTLGPDNTLWFVDSALHQVVHVVP